MGKKTLYIGVLIAVIFVGSLVILYGKQGMYLQNGQNTAATVNGQTIQKSLVDKKASESAQFFTWSKQAIDMTKLQKNELDNLINLALSEQFAKQKNIIITDQEVSSRYQSLPAVEKNESEFLAKLQAMYGIGKAEYLEKVREDILKEKIQQVTQKPWLTWVTEQRKQASITLK